MTTYRYTSASFQHGLLPDEAEEKAEQLISVLDKNPVLRGAVIALDENFNQFDITASVDADSQSQLAVLCAFHAADQEWLTAVEAVGMRKRICRSEIQADSYHA